MYAQYILNRILIYIYIYIYIFVSISSMLVSFFVISFVLARTHGLNYTPILFIVLLVKVKEENDKLCLQNEKIQQKDNVSF